MEQQESEVPKTGSLSSLLQRVVEARPEEVGVLLLSGAYFFFVPASYYVIRPIRDEMAVVGGVENIAWLFSGTLLGTLLIHPLFTWAVSRYPRKKFIPIAYRFFILNLLLFFIFMRVAPTGAYVWIGRAFFSWTSVFNLFVVSVFWAFMADIFRSGQGKRLFGFIGMGGTLGGILGAVLTASLAEILGPVNLLLVSMVFLETAVRLVRVLGRKVAVSGSEPGAPAAFFARIDLFVNILALLTQAFLTGRIIKWFGLGVALAILPVVTVVGLIWLGIAPTLTVLFLVQVFRRGWNYGLMKPALEALYTVIPREEKYKAKNFIDTTIYRTGDQVGAWCGST